MYNNFYSSVFIQNTINNRVIAKSNSVKLNSEYTIKNWIADFRRINKDEFQKELKQILQQPYKKQQIKHGDYFAFKLENNNYGFGRVLFDMNSKKYVNKMEPYLETDDIYNSHPLHMPYSSLIEIYSYQSRTYDIDITKLNKSNKVGLSDLYSNEIICGRFPIIGNKSVEEGDFDFLKEFYISHHRVFNTKKYFFFWGLFFCEIIPDESLLELIKDKEELYINYMPLSSINLYTIGSKRKREPVHLDMPEYKKIKDRIYSLLSLPENITYDELCRLKKIPGRDIFV